MMRQKILPLAVILYIFTSAVGMGGIITSQTGGWLRLQLIGEQKYLVEKISKSTCFAMANVHVKENQDKVLKAVRRFDAISSLLRDGNDINELTGDRRKIVMHSFERIDKDWQTFRAAAFQIAAGDLHFVAMREILDLGPQLSKSVETSFQTVEAVFHLKNLSSAGLARSINLAVTQKMMAMRLAKEYCYLTLDIGRVQMIDAIQKTGTSFIEYMHAMETGDVDMGIIPPPNEEAVEVMHKMTIEWAQTAAILHALIAAPETGYIMFDEMGYQAVTLGSRAQQMLDIYLAQ